MKSIVAVVLCLSLTAFAGDSNPSDTPAIPVAKSHLVFEGQQLRVEENGILLNNAAADNIDKAIKDLRADNEKLVNDYNEAAKAANESFTPKMVALFVVGGVVAGLATGAVVAIAISHPAH